MARASSRAGMMIETKGPRCPPPPVPRPLRRWTRIRFVIVRKRERTQPARMSAERRRMASLRGPSEVQTAQTTSGAGRADLPLRLDRIGRVGKLRGNAAVGVARLFDLPLRVVRVREQHQEGVRRQKGLI